MRQRAEARLEREILLDLGTVPDLCLYRNEVGQGHPAIIGRLIRQTLARRVDPEICREVLDILNRNRITYGLGVGSPDLVGAVAGVAIGMELKTPTGRLSDEQTQYHEAARRRGCIVEVVRSVDDARGVIRLARICATKSPRQFLEAIYE